LANTSVFVDDALLADAEDCRLLAHLDEGFSAFSSCIS
jgi:hypothetical protein